MADQVLSWLGTALALATAIVFAWFVEALLKTILQRPSVGFAGAAGGLAGTAEAPFGQAANHTLTGKLNARLLGNPWIAEFLEKDYYGLGQKKEMEPSRMLWRMEKAGVIGVIVVGILSIWIGIRVNPGLLFMGFIAGFLLPHLDARNAIAKRQKQALMKLPSFVDLLALTIESGLDYLNSMERIVVGMNDLKKKGPLEEEVENVLREVQLGYPRRDALRHFARRMDVQEVRSLVGLLIQSDELGTALVNLLRNFSQDMRNRRVGRAEAMAGKAATKMLGPMMLFIFPVIFALILAPFAYSLFRGGGAGMPF